LKKIVDVNLLNLMKKNIFKSIYEIPYNAKIGLYGASGTGEIVKRIFNVYRPDIEVLCFFDTYKEGKFCDLPVVKFGTRKFDKYFNKVDYVIISSVFEYDIFKNLKNYFENIDLELLNKVHLLPIHLLDCTQNIYKNIGSRCINSSLVKKQDKVYYLVFYASSLNRNVILKIEDKIRKNKKILNLSSKCSLVPIKLNLHDFAEDIIIEAKNANIIAFFDVNKIKLNKESNKNYKYSVIVVNYNTENNILNLLETINENTYDNLEIIIIDNKPQGLDKLIKDKFKATKIFSKIKYIPSNRNLGYAGGVNLGSLFATGDVIHVLNPDTLLPEKFYETINRYINLYGLNYIYGHTYNTVGSLTNYQVPVSGIYSIFSLNIFSVLNNCLTLGTLGTSFLIPVKLLEQFPKNKIYNELYFMDAEDLDFSLYSLSSDINSLHLYDENTIIYHESHSSFSYVREKRFYEAISKILYIYYKYYKYYDLPVSYSIKINKLVKLYGFEKVFVSLLNLIENSYQDIFIPKEKLKNDVNFWFKYSGHITLEDISDESYNLCKQN